MDIPKVKNENAVKARKASAAARKAKQEALISQLDRLKEISTSPPPMDEEKIKKSPIESSFVMHPIFMLSALIVLVDGIFFYKSISAPVRQTSAPLTIAAPVAFNITSLIQKDDWTI